MSSRFANSPVVASGGPTVVGGTDVGAAVFGGTVVGGTVVGTATVKVTGADAVDRPAMVPWVAVMV
jgi:hypothetical protein